LVQKTLNIWNKGGFEAILFISRAHIHPHLEYITLSYALSNHYVPSRKVFTTSGSFFVHMIMTEEVVATMLSNVYTKKTTGKQAHQWKDINYWRRWCLESFKVRGKYLIRINLTKEIKSQIASRWPSYLCFIKLWLNGKTDKSLRDLLISLPFFPTWLHSSIWIASL